MKKKLENTKKSSPKKASPEKENLLSFFKTLVAAIICAAIVRSFFFEPFHIPSSSMKPGLLIGDYIFVSKYSYGYSKYSFPFSLPLFSGRIMPSDPQRGDVVVFRLPSDPSVNYIKRLIGLPGDLIRMKDGVLYINKKPIPKEFAGNFYDEETRIPQFKEILPNGKMVTVLDQFYDTPQDTTGEYLVPEDHYFMMGDNRDNSQDSRFSELVGYVPKENLIGKAQIIFFSVNEKVWKIWRWPSSLRTNRVFEKIS